MFWYLLLITIIRKFDTLYIRFLLALFNISYFSLVLFSYVMLCFLCV